MEATLLEAKIMIERLPYKKKNLISFDIGSETDK